MTAPFELGLNIIEFFFRPILIFVLKNRCSVLLRHCWTIVHVGLFSDIGHVVPKID